MRFPGTARGAGQLALVQESGQVLQAEIEDIELVLPRESPPLFISVPIRLVR